MLFKLIIMAFAVAVQAKEYVKVYPGTSLNRPKEVIEFAVQEQPQIVRKALKHYLVSIAMKENSTGRTKAKISDILRSKLADSYIADELRRFIQKELFETLDMNTMVDSLQQDIWLNPEKFFLTYEIYDLLVDERIIPEEID